MLKSLNNSLFDCISIHHSLDIIRAQELLKSKVIQGNFDPDLLESIDDQKQLEEKVTEMLKNYKSQNIIANLGHGIQKTTPVKNVEIFVNKIHDFDVEALR